MLLFIYVSIYLFIKKFSLGLDLFIYDLIKACFCLFVYLFIHS